MQYLVMIYRDETKDGEVDWAKLGRDYEAYTNAAVEAGVMRGGLKLQPSVSTTTVKVRDGKHIVTDGPFIEAREQLGGYYVLECADLDDALAWAGRCPGAEHGTVEVRPVVPH